MAEKSRDSGEVNSLDKACGVSEFGVRGRAHRSPGMAPSRQGKETKRQRLCCRRRLASFLCPLPFLLPILYLSQINKNYLLFEKKIRSTKAVPMGWAGGTKASHNACVHSVALDGAWREQESRMVCARPSLGWSHQKSSVLEPVGTQASTQASSSVTMNMVGFCTAFQTRLVLCLIKTMTFHLICRELDSTSPCPPPEN